MKVTNKHHATSTFCFQQVFSSTMSKYLIIFMQVKNIQQQRLTFFSKTSIEHSFQFKRPFKNVRQPDGLPKMA